MAAIVKTGDIWEAFGKVDLFCFCSSVQYDPDKEGLIMKDSFAGEILKKMPDIDVVLWKLIEPFMDKTKVGQLDYRPFIGFAYVKNKKHNQTVALFQTKGMWIDKAHPFVVANSFAELVKFTYLFLAANSNPPTIVMDNPAEGSQALNISNIYNHLPSNITIYNNPNKDKKPSLHIDLD